MIPLRVFDCQLAISDWQLVSAIANRQLEIGNESLGGVRKDQPIEIRIVTQWVQVMIVLGTNTQVGL